MHKILDKSQQCIAALKKGESVTFEGVFGSAHALLASEIADGVQKPLLFVLPSDDDVERAIDDLAFFSVSGVLAFPASESLLFGKRPESELQSSNSATDEETEGYFDSGFSVSEPSVELPSVGDDLLGQRTQILKMLLEPASVMQRLNIVIVTSIPALLQPVPSKSTLKTHTRTLKIGESIDQKALTDWLVKGGFSNAPGIDLPGEIAVRGAILDIFAPDWDSPVRIEFYDDEIESIRRFDIASQRSRELLKSIDITLVNAESQYQSHFIEYMPKETVILLAEPQELENAGRTYLQRLEHPKKLHSVSGVFKELLKFTVATSVHLAQGFDEIKCRLPIQSVDRLQGNLETVRAELERVESGEIHIVCPTEAEIKRLSEAFADLTPMKEKRLFLTIGRLSSGFCINSNIFIGSGQLFGRREVRRLRRRQLGQVIDSFLELKPGDLIVHVSHGIGRFRGLVMLTKAMQEEEHLQLEFAEKAILYVPVSKIQLVQKYVAGSRSKPKLAKLGGQLWSRHKKAVQEAIFDLAVEMIDLQAARETKPGIAFPEDSEWQSEFDAAFPYQETGDQLDAIDSIKTDMQKNRPMDRLICGDVGFGKTEVAMRAAFKAADAGYQVAVLVPTTILAEQHYRTFSERMSEFPFSIAALSRFQSPKEQREIVDALSVGKIDVVIGTHRIVSKDVEFHNLGLVVIDEEQRFGVVHKERLKTLKETVDVLTLTATPIPRTLHFSLLGIRDISNLETPPEDRLAVETRLARFNDDLIHTALIRELARGGQTFFVHNRVSDIEQVAARINRIVPEARICIGHAQMAEGELESVMHDFIAHKYDVLVCTTIIESGVDIPNANTIFIDEADRYGLADLHQLRGRVGRYKHQAYCYLLVSPNKPLTPEATKRLRAIEEYSHLGAGFHLAMKDLEIRGAGNILGTQQSGHIAAIGYEMYCQFLESAVRTLKNQPQKTQIEVEIDLPGNFQIPKSYVENQRMKIDLYRRLTRVTNEGQLSDLRQEIVDRFGKYPKEVKRLLELTKIRIESHGYRIRTIRLEKAVSGDPSLPDGGFYVVFEYVSQEKIDELREKLRLKRIPLRSTEDRCAYIPMKGIVDEPDAILKFVNKIFAL